MILLPFLQADWYKIAPDYYISDDFLHFVLKYVISAYMASDAYAHSGIMVDLPPQLQFYTSNTQLCKII